MSTKKSTQLPRINLFDLARMPINEVFTMLSRCSLDIQQSVLEMRIQAVKVLETHS